MRNYKVNFYKVEKELNEKGKEVNRKYSHVGSVTIDDCNVDNINLTLISKAYRHANNNLLMADKVTVEEIR